ncbi:hypothetical protein LJC48_03975 [Desulfovibrio sp. OttesenSCG-928-C06]|nr:hypothetical protein [Desulfovibrio sp. OttesenSCG-928-C06]
MEHLEFQPHMSTSEAELLVSFIPNTGRVLEFGAGGSTQLFFEHGVSHLYSLESDSVWLNKIIASPNVSVNLKYGRWTPLHADIGLVGDWGAPAARKPQARWLNYHQHCWEAIPERNFDFILIDGRFRVACLCQSLLRCNNDCLTFAFHDFFDRPWYHIVLGFVDIVAQADTLAILKPKQTVDWRKLNLVLQAHQFLFD